LPSPLVPGLSFCSLESPASSLKGLRHANLATGCLGPGSAAHPERRIPLPGSTSKITRFEWGSRRRLVRSARRGMARQRLGRGNPSRFCSQVKVNRAAAALRPIGCSPVGRRCAIQKFMNAITTRETIATLIASRQSRKHTVNHFILPGTASPASDNPAPFRSGSPGGGCRHGEGRGCGCPAVLPPRCRYLDRRRLFLLRFHNTPLVKLYLWWNHHR
jgi:hypothetical protein